MAENLEQAVLLSFDQTGSVDPAVKEQAVTYCNQLKNKPDSWAICLERFPTTQRIEVKFWCLQTLLEVICARYETLGTDAQALVGPLHFHHLIYCRHTPTLINSQAANGGAGVNQLAVIKETMMGWVQNNDLLQQQAFLRNKLAQAITAIVKVEYPKQWPSFFHDLMTAAQRGPAMVDIFCRIMLSIDSDVITLEIHRTAQGSRMSMHLKDSLRETCIGDIAQTWYQLVSIYRNQQPEIAVMVLRTVQRYISWMDIGLVANDKFIPLLFSLLGGPHEELQEASVECLTEILMKGMDPSAKLELIQKLNLVPSCAQWKNELPGSDGDELQVKCAKLLATLCMEVIDTWKQVENKLVSFKAVGIAVDKEAAKEMASASRVFEQIIDELFPAVMTVLKEKDETVAMTVVPFLNAYIVRLKLVQKRSNSIPAKDLDKLKSILEGIVICGRYPEASWCPVGPIVSETEASALKEEKEFVENMRRDVFVLYKNIARIALADTVRFIDQELKRTLSNPQAAFQDVEMVVSLVFELGEAASDEMQKSYCGLLGALAVVLMQANIPCAQHQLVALTLLEAYVRYAKVLAQNQQLLPGVVATFIDSRGMQHLVEDVSNRACYLFMRFVKVLRSVLKPLTMSILNNLQPYLQQVARTPKLDYVTGSTQTSVSTDDRMCVFEAVGLLMGSEDMTPNEQKHVIVMFLQPLISQIEGCIGAANDQQVAKVALVQQALEGISRFSKGFKQELTTENRPAIGQLFVQCLELGLRVPPVFPDSNSLRTRFISFLHRMVETIGPLAVPYLPASLEVLMHHGCDVSGLMDVLAVLNQLINRFKGTLEDLLGKVLPVLAAEIHSKLGPNWDWNGAAACPAKHLESSAQANGATGLMEENREKGELQKAYYALLLTLGTCDGLERVLINVQQNSLEAILTNLIQGAGTHVDATVRKTCIQVLASLVDKWGDRIDSDQGFKWFVMDKIGGDVCIGGVFQGVLDPKDAATFGYLGEVSTTLRVITDKCGYDFVAHLSSTVFPRVGIPDFLRTELVDKIQKGDPKALRGWLKSTLIKFSR